MNVRGAPAAPGLDPICDQREHRVEVAAREVLVGSGAPHQVEQLRLLPRLRRAGRDDLLGEDVERRLGRMHRVELARAHAAHERGALDQLVARRGKQASLRHGAARMARAADSLEEGGQAARRAELTHQLDGPDVDAQLERRGRDECCELAVAQPLLDALAALDGEAAVMRRDAVRAEPLAEQVRDPLGLPARVGEHQRRAVLRHERGDLGEDLAPLLHRARPPRARSPAPRSRDRARGGGPRRRSRSAGGRRGGSPPPTRPRAAARSARSAAASRTGRSAPGGARTAPRAARARAPDASRACRARSRGSRRRSPCAYRAASRGCAPR